MSESSSGSFSSNSFESEDLRQN